MNCPPSLPEVVAYGKKIAPTMDIEVFNEFFRYWTGRGWMMTDRVRASDFRPLLDQRIVDVARKPASENNKKSPEKSKRSEAPAGRTDGRTAPQARFELKKELDALNVRLETAYQMNVPPDADDKKRAKELEAALAQLEEAKK